jgi:hypothetical protein
MQRNSQLQNNQLAAPSHPPYTRLKALKTFGGKGCRSITTQLNFHNCILFMFTLYLIFTRSHIL